MRDLFTRRPPSPSVTVPDSPEQPDWRDGRDFDPLDPTDGKPRLLLTWCETPEGNGFAVDVWNLATVDIARFYLEAGSAVASCIRDLEGKNDAPAMAPLPTRSAAAQRDDDRRAGTQRTRALIASSTTTTEE